MTPAIALLPWGDLVEDFLDPIGLALEDWRDTMTGGWLFGYVDALSAAGVHTVLVCVSARVRRVERWTHAPTGATLVVLPARRGYLALRRARDDPHAWSADRAAPGRRGVRKVQARAAHELAPYLATPPRELGRTLRRERCAAVLCQEYEYQRFDACVGLGRLLGLPVHATYQGGDRARTTLERPLRRLSLRACDGLIVAARSEARRVRERYGVPEARIARIFNPVDLAPWRSGPRPEVRAELGLAADATVVAWHGRVEMHRKGLDVLLDAWAEVRGAGRHLLLVGTGADASALRREIDGRGLDDVTWLDAYVLERERLAALLGAADVYAFPSRHEGFPAAPVEAMACGLPVVAADAPGVEDIFEGGTRSGGVIVPRGDAPAFAAALGDLLRRPELRATLGRQAAERAGSAFAPTRVGQRLRATLLG